MKTLIDIPEPDIRALDDLGRRRRQSRARIVRAAVQDYLARHRVLAVDAALGLWGEGGEDGLAYQRRLRAEW